MEGWSSCWEEKADILEKPRQLSVLVPRGQEGPITQIALSETSPASFALNGRGKPGATPWPLPLPNPLSGYGPLALSRRPGDACFCVVYAETGGTQNLLGWDPDFKGAQGRAEVPYPKSWAGNKGPTSLIHRRRGEACNRLAASLCGPGCVGSDSTGTTQKAAGSLCAITWSPQIPSLPVRKAGMGKGGWELKKGWTTGAES